MPNYDDIDWRGLDFPQKEWDELMAYDRKRLKMSTIEHEKLFLELFDHLPKELIFEKELFICRL